MEELGELVNRPRMQRYLLLGLLLLNLTVFNACVHRPKTYDGHTITCPVSVGKGKTEDKEYSFRYNPAYHFKPGKPADRKGYVQMSPRYAVEIGEGAEMDSTAFKEIDRNSRTYANSVSKAMELIHKNIDPEVWPENKIWRDQYYASVDQWGQIADEGKKDKDKGFITNVDVKAINPTAYGR